MHSWRPSLRSKPNLAIYTVNRTFSQSSRLHKLASAERQLAGKHCIITGASRGIGAEIARRFAREGARCLLIGRNESLLGKVREELEKVGEGEFWGLLKKEVSCVPFLWGDLGYVDFRGQNEC
jgi:hypothetical protein